MSTLHTTELSLLAAIIFYSNSLVLICDHFLIISYLLTMLITLVSLTCFFLIIRDFLIKGNKSFEALYWNFHFLMSAYLLNAGDSKAWTFSRGLYSLFFGFTILALYTLYTWIIPPCQGQDQQQEEQNQSPYVVPLAVVISFIFIGNGIALMGRCCFFNSHDFMLVGAGLMFLASAVFFTFYYLYSSVKPSVPVNLHED